MDLMHVVVRFIISLEFFLVALIVVMTFLLKILFDYIKKENTRRAKEIELFFVDLVSFNKEYHESDFLKSWKNIEAIVPIIHALDARFKKGAWLIIRDKFILSTLLPLARVAATKKKWLLRFYASESFSMKSEKQDEEIVEKLVQDKVALVFYSSLNAAIQNRFESCINAVITRITTENWLTKSIFLQVFDKAPMVTRFLVERRLMNSNDFQVRATCYNILLRYPFGKARWDYHEDLNSKNINLKISTIKYIAHIKGKLAIPLLIKQLSDPLWEVRTATLRCLSDVFAIEAIPEIAHCLFDKHWWVKFAAAQTLKNLGEEGEKVLELQGEVSDSEVGQVAMHVLNRL